MTRRINPGTNERRRDRAVLQAFAGGAGARVVSGAISLVSVGLATRFLGADAYGVLAVITGFVSLLGFLDFGIGLSLISDVAAAHARQDSAHVQKAVVNSLAALSTIGASVVAIGVPVIFLVPTELYFPASSVPSSDVRVALLVFILLLGLSFPANVGPRLATASQRGAAASVASSLSSVLSLVLVLVAVTLEWPLAAFVAIFVSNIILTNAILLAYVLVKDRRSIRLSLNALDRRSIVRAAVSGAPFFVLTATLAIAYQTDILVVAFVASASAAGVYGVINKIFASLIPLLGGGLQQLWGSISHAAATGEYGWVARRFRSVFSITLAIFAIASTCVVVLGPVLIPLWAGSQFQPGFGLLVAFAVWNTYNFGMSTISALLNGLGIVWAQAIPAVFMVSLNLPLSIWLTHLWGPVGPLYGSLISHVITIGWTSTLITYAVFHPGKLARLERLLRMTPRSIENIN